MPSKPDPQRSARLTDVYARAERLRRQRRSRWVGGAGVASAALFAIGILVGSNLDSSRLVTTIGPASVASSTTAGPRPETGDASAPAADPSAVSGAPSGSGTEPDGATPRRDEPDSPETAATTVSAPGTAAPVSTAPPATTTTVAPCRSSRDPACGPLRYEPEPANAPMSVEVRFRPERPRPGEEVTFTVRVGDDGPATAGSCINTQTFGEAGEDVSLCTASCAAPEPRYGSWEPPPPENVEFEETFTHTYGEAGTYTATFAYNQGSDCSFSPYRSTGEATVTVPVG
jgi:hypothetical protein